jgi:hypothetical protein
MTEISSKAIFIGGVGRSGTTLMTQLLDKHREIASFGETKLIDHKVFRSFPRWIYECPSKQKNGLLDVFKQLCLTRFFRFRLIGVNPTLLKGWKRLETIWLLRFQHPQSLAWRNPIWGAVEKLWLSEAVQGCTFGLGVPNDIQAQDMLGLRGLYYRNTSRELGSLFSQNDIKENFTILEKLKEAIAVDEVYRTYGRFWSAVFSTYAQKRSKRYWAEKTPSNALHALFFEHCFDDLKIINLIRDGRDVACSTVAMWRGDLKPAMDRWGKWLTKTLEVQKKMSHSNYINIRYEDLVLQNRSTLKRVTDFLEVDFDQTMLSHQMHSSSVRRYKDGLTLEMKGYASDRYGNLLRQWGYCV